MVTITDLLNVVNPILIDRITNGEISEDSVIVTVRYLLQEGTKIYYNQTMTVMQSIFQFIEYAQDIVYRLMVLKVSIETIIPSSNFFYIFANNLSTIPDILITLFNNLLLSITNQMDNGFTVFVIVKALIAALIITSGVIIFIYYRIIYKNYYGKVLIFYQLIRVEHIKLY